MIIISELYYEWLFPSIALVLMMLLHLLYVRPVLGTVYLRTGWGKPRILLKTGAFVLPGLHRLTLLDLQTHSLMLALEKDASLRTKDLFRVDTVLIASVRIAVSEVTSENLSNHYQQPNWQEVQTWWSTLCRGSLATLISSIPLEALHQQRQEIMQQLTLDTQTMLRKHSLELVSLSLAKLEETDIQYYDTKNALDMKGLTLLENMRVGYSKQRYLNKKEAELSLARSNFETTMQHMAWERDEFVARLQHIRFKAEADAKAEQELEEIQMAKDLALEMMQRDVTLMRFQNEQELKMARVALG